jgi:DNA repair exonuclease SbcCD nuclease subunit
MSDKNTQTRDTLIIGDLHCNQKRPQAWQTAADSIFSIIKGIKFQRCILTGDLFNKTPTITERVMVAKLLKSLAKQCSQIILIKGTDTHEFSQGVYNFEDITLLTDIQAVEEFKLGDFIFGHYEVKGTKYVNGHLSGSTKTVDKSLKYYLGHIHSPQCSFDNITYVGSIYKVTFSEIEDTKRICILQAGVAEFYEIKSYPMKVLRLTGSAGKVKIRGLKQITDKNLDLKIVAETDTVSLPEIHRAIFQIKEKLNIEYYQEDIKIKEVQSDVPEDLDREELLKKFCKIKQIDFKLVESELKKPIYN